MHRGYIKIWRKMYDNPRMRNPHFCALWVAILIEANHKERREIFKGKEIICKPGQFTTGRKQLAQKVGLTESKTQRYLSVMEECNQIEQQTSSASRLITVTKWDQYQCSEQQMNIKRTTSEQPVNTPKECNNAKNVKNVYDEEIERLYSLYPSTDKTNNNRSTGKSKKCKEKIGKLLKSGNWTVETLEENINAYLKNCRQANTYLKNFDTYLNNIPELPSKDSSRSEGAFRDTGRREARLLT